MIRIVTFALLAIVSFTAWAGESRPGRSEKHNFNVVLLVDGLENPWSIAWLPDGRMLVTERAGRLRVVSKDLKLDPQHLGFRSVCSFRRGRLCRRRQGGPL